MDEHRRETISRLKFIARIKPHEKVSIGKLSMHPDNMLTSISRTYYQEDSKIKTFTFVEKTVFDGFELAAEFLNEQDPCKRVLGVNLLRDLKRCRVGIGNLKVTYSSYIKFGCDLDTLLEDINAKLNNLAALCPLHFKDSLSSSLNDSDEDSVSDHPSHTDSN